MSNPSDRETVADLFDLSVETERRAQELYSRFAELFSSVEEVATFWQEMAQDEATHAQQLEEIRAELTPEQLDAPVEAFNLWELRASLGISVDQKVKSVKNLEDAYQIAHELEYSEVNSLFKSIVNQFMSHERQKSFALLQLREHMGRLEAFGSSRWIGSFDRWDLP